jgi:hypothetical protein
MSFRQSRWLFTTGIIGLLVLGCSGGNGDATPTDGSSDEPVENLDLDATPAPSVTLNLEVTSSDMASLDADPFNAPDVPGAFTDAVSVRHAPIDVNYRGAYALQTLIRSGALQRNWKLKFAKELPYQNRREWNFTQVPATGKWVFIPWDMDGTFQSTKFSLDPIGTDASVFYQFDNFVEYKGRQAAEGTARTLVTRMMKVPAFRSDYVAHYRAALEGFLAQDYLMTMVAKFSAIAEAAAQPDELPLLDEERADVEKFIGLRFASVSAELANQP